MQITNITAVAGRDTIATDEPATDQPYATVTLTVDGGDDVQIIIHPSTEYGDAVNIEIDGHFADAFPSLRIHLNDRLIVDTEYEPPAEIEGR